MHLVFLGSKNFRAFGAIFYTNKLFRIDFYKPGAAGAKFLGILPFIFVFKYFSACINSSDENF